MINKILRILNLQRRISLEELAKKEMNIVGKRIVKGNDEIDILSTDYTEIQDAFLLGKFYYYEYDLYKNGKIVRRAYTFGESPYEAMKVAFSGELNQDPFNI